MSITPPSKTLTGAAFVLLVPAILWKAYVSTVLWGWFVCPLGAPPISIGGAVGLNTLLHLFIGDTYKPDSYERQMHMLVAWIFSPALALLIGWLAK